VTSVEDLLERTPGVQIRRFGGEGYRRDLDPRLDGLAGGRAARRRDVNSAQSGAVDLSTIPLSLLERIEVSRRADRCRPAATRSAAW
jgi:outer membrane cobalamin receptor